jgi:hypothetical protein
MQHTTITILVGLLCASRALASDGIIHNDTVWRDTAGQEIWCNGGHVLHQGDRFYWVGYDTGPGRPWRINLYTSRNLADWEFENTLVRQEGKFAAMGWAGRPSLLQNRTTKKYVLLFEACSSQWPRNRTGFATCDRIDGRYELVQVQTPELNRSEGDQAVYQNGDAAYLLCTLDKDIEGRKYLNQSLAIFRLADDYQSVAKKVFEGFDNVSGNKAVAPRDHTSREACYIAKGGDLYYWFSSGLLGWNSSATMYATAKDLAGPWSELKLLRTDPPSKDSYNTQHDFIVTVAGKETTTYVYAGDRYSQWTSRGPGRNIFLPLVWENGEPVLRWHKDWKIDAESGRFVAVPQNEKGQDTR